MFAPYELAAGMYDMDEAVQTIGIPTCWSSTPIWMKLAYQLTQLLFENTDDCCRSPSG